MVKDDDKSKDELDDDDEDTIEAEDLTGQDADQVERANAHNIQMNEARAGSDRLQAIGYLVDSMAPFFQIHTDPGGATTAPRLSKHVQTQLDQTMIALLREAELRSRLAAHVLNPIDPEQTAIDPDQEIP